jgi:hypothetical protein
MLKDRLRNNIKVYGPYTRADGRQHVILYDGKNRRTMSYPKWLTEQRLGLTLKKEDTVDHVDRDVRNNRSDNLAVLERSVHASLDVTRVHRVSVKCIWCKQKFEVRPSQANRYTKLGKAGPFCSKICSGRYGAYVQQGGERFADRKLLEVKYFKMNK